MASDDTLTVTFTCDECGRKFKSNSTLDRHRKFSHPIYMPGFIPLVKTSTRKPKSKKVSICTICGQTFPTAQDMNNHKRGKHQIGEGKACEYCGRIFFWVRSYRTHVKDRRCSVLKQQLAEMLEDDAAKNAAASSQITP